MNIESIESVALVCNGPSLLDNDYYKGIDTCDVAYRVNPISDNEFLGSKHDVSIVTYNIDTRHRRYWADNVVVLGEVSNVHNDDLCNRNYKFEHNDYGLEQLIRTLAHVTSTTSATPTTGLWALYYLMDKYRDANIFIYGMDLYRDYDNAYIEGCLLDVELLTRIHKIFVERILVEELDRDNERIHWMVDRSKLKPIEDLR